VALLVSNVCWSEADGGPEGAIAEVLACTADIIRSTYLVKKSLDARHGKQRWRGVFRVETEDDDAVLARQPASVRRWSERDAGRYGLDAHGPERRPWPSAVRPVIVGAGPAGLFAALFLAEAGADVLVLERGQATGERVTAVNAHWRRRSPLDPENNIVFGEGGAGTFSDGKIYTRRRDGELGFIFRRFVDFGADPAVLQEAWAHLGTDKVREILPVFRARLRELGVEVRFGARVDELLIDGQRCVGVRLADGQEIRRAPVLMATGHSARDSAELMVRAGAAAAARAIAVGARIEHPQSMIDLAQYKRDRGAELPAASYRLTWAPQGGRKVHTFCMCPGGVVVPASNHPGRVVVNGMSFAARRAFWANSAVIVEVKPEDFGAADPLAGFRWQDDIERRAFELGGGTEAAPAQRFVDLEVGRPSAEIPRTSYAHGVAPADLGALLPRHVVAGMIDAVRAWDERLPGFAGADAVLIAPETRTTSPVRFERTDEGESTTIRDLFPLGEGAGYAGGIVSSALDGLRAARALTARVVGGRTA
jgi:uncharacterized protein